MTYCPHFHIDCGETQCWAVVDNIGRHGMSIEHIIDPEGGALQMIVHDKSEIGGPLNQFSTIGYKFETNGATMLYPERLLRVMSCSSYSATDAEN